MIVCDVAQSGFGLLALGIQAIGIAHHGFQENDAEAFSMVAIPLAMTLFVIIGAVRMIMLKNYTLVIITTVVSLMCGLLSFFVPMAFGVWAVIVLCDFRVREHFS
mgnify:CR=1 FL=1